MTAVTNSLYAAKMSPRLTRDTSAVGVVIHLGGRLGRGTEEEGGGALQGGLTLMNRFKAVISDPEVPYEITMTVGARDGWLACESLTLAVKDGGPAVTGAALRGVTLALYMQRIRQELGEAGGGGIINKLVDRTEAVVVFEPPDVEELEGLDFAQIRRAVKAAKITPEMAAGAYREAQASPDPSKNRRPTAAAAERLGISRGHASRLLTEARRKGIPGIGPTRPPRRRSSS